MPLAQTARLPFTDNFSVDIQIRIFSNSSGYVAEICAERTGWHRFRIGLTPTDVAELNTVLQQGIQQVADEFETGGVRKDALSKFAQIGNFAFKKIFADGIPREIISKALRTGSTIQFSSEDFFIPWELLYDGPISAQVDISRFWGMRHVVSRALIQDARDGDYESPVIQSSCPHVGLIACSTLQQVVEKEIPTLRRLHQNRQIQLSPMRSMHADRRDKELDEFGRFLRKKLQIVHLACHAREKEPASQSYLLVSDEFSITMQDFYVRDFAIKYKPLVILNACLTGTINPLHTFNWAAEFWRRGARGVLATEFHVPDWFAAAFTEELYKHFLAGKPIGEALIATRRHFWEEQRNPLGLAYALYSSPSIRITN